MQPLTTALELSFQDHQDKNLKHLLFCCIIAFMNLSEKIKQEALSLGFDILGITDASPIEPGQVQMLREWIEKRCPADIKYMQRNLEKRTNPGVLLKSAESVICLAINYNPPGLKEPGTAEPAGRVANYALYEDYHNFIKKRLRLLREYISSLVPDRLEIKLCVDSVPIAERALAQRAGLGFIGKNHMLINPRLGPQLFLAEIITDLPLKADEPIDGNCKGCNRCIEACPTGALQQDGTLDAARCISYLTIEHEGPIPSELQGKMGDRLFGCDECVLVCPYTQQAPLCSNKEIQFYPDRKWISLKEIFELTPQSFEKKFSNSPLYRPGLENLKRNARICLRNFRKLSYQ